MHNPTQTQHQWHLSSLEVSSFCFQTLQTWRKSWKLRIPSGWDHVSENVPIGSCVENVPIGSCIIILACWLERGFRCRTVLEEGHHLPHVWFSFSILCLLLKMWLLSSLLLLLPTACCHTPWHAGLLALWNHIPFCKLLLVLVFFQSNRKVTNRHSLSLLAGMMWCGKVSHDLNSLWILYSVISISVTCENVLLTAALWDCCHSWWLK